MNMGAYIREMFYMKKPLIILTGPTAVGKTALSLKLAKAIGGEIISADSMQVYKGMDIGSAKIMPDEMEGVPHHLVDFLSPKEEFNVFLFQKYAKEAMEKIYAAGHIPILVGGTGFYIQSILYDIQFAEEGVTSQADVMSSDDTTSCEDIMSDADGADATPDCQGDIKVNDAISYREHLEHLAAAVGPQALHAQLAAVDPAAAERIHYNNVKRVIRALEYYHLYGQPISEHNEKERAKESPYDFVYFVLTDDRARIYDGIEARVDIMLEKGLVAEVETLMEAGCTKDDVSMQGLGYKEIIAYLQGEYDLERAIYLIKRDTRHFAKRQLTWFRREKNVTWIDKSAFAYDADAILDYMISKIQGMCINPDAKT